MKSEGQEYIVFTHDNFSCRAVVCADGELHFSGKDGRVDLEPVPERIFAVVKVPPRGAKHGQ